MGIITTVLLPALLPVLADGARTAFRWFFGGAPAEPMNMEERIALMTAETAKLQALAVLDAPLQNISPWVSNLRASFRYLGPAAIIALASVAVLFNGYGWTVVPDNVLLLLLDMMSSVFSFMFGERLYMHLRMARDK